MGYLRRSRIALVGVLAAGAASLPLAGATATAGATTTATGSSTIAPKAKLSPSMKILLAQGGYDSIAASQVGAAVDGFQAGDVFYLAKLNTAVDDVATTTALKVAGADVRFRYPSIGGVALVSKLGAIRNVDALSQVNTLEVDRVPQVQSMDVQYLQAPAASSADFANQNKRGTHDVGADQLWSKGITGRGVTVGVTDSGIDGTNPDLDDQDWGAWDATNRPPKIASFVNCMAVLPEAGGQCAASPPVDDNGHGTHVSGIIGGSAEGGSAAQHGRLPGMAP